MAAAATKNKAELKTKAKLDEIECRRVSGEDPVYVGKRFVAGETFEVVHVHSLEAQAGYSAQNLKDRLIASAEEMAMWLRGTPDGYGNPTFDALPPFDAKDRKVVIAIMVI